jgi:hypothetical protein
MLARRAGRNPTLKVSDEDRQRTDGRQSSRILRLCRPQSALAWKAEDRVAPPIASSTGPSWQEFP